jgi:hypothetical protein
MTAARTSVLETRRGHLAGDPTYTDVPQDDTERATAEMGAGRTKLINRFLRWYLHRRGAKLPERPPK